MPPKAAAVSAPTFTSETPADALSVEALLDRAFGPGRFVKVSERVRERALFRPDFSVCAWVEARLVGAVRMWQVRVAGAPIIFLGPLAVDDALRTVGLGGQLVEDACRRAAAAGFHVVVLVGDEPYFRRFGFSADGTKGLQLPGPVDQRRVLARGATTPLVGPVSGGS